MTRELCSGRSLMRHLGEYPHENRRAAGMAAGVETINVQNRNLLDGREEEMNDMQSLDSGALCVHSYQGNVHARYGFISGWGCDVC